MEAYLIDGPLEGRWVSEVEGESFIPAGHDGKYVLDSKDPLGRGEHRAVAMRWVSGRSMSFARMLEQELKNAEQQIRKELQRENPLWEAIRKDKRGMPEIVVSPADLEKWQNEHAKLSGIEPKLDGVVF